MRMAVESVHFRMADRVVEGQLETILRDAYGQDRNWEQVSRRLYAEHGLSISGQTLRRWARQLGITDKAA